MQLCTYSYARHCVCMYLHRFCVARRGHKQLDVGEEGERIFRCAILGSPRVFVQSTDLSSGVYKTANLFSFFFSFFLDRNPVLLIDLSGACVCGDCVQLWYLSYLKPKCCRT